MGQGVTGGTLTSNTDSFQLRDGVVAWTETVTSTSSGSYGRSTTTVSGLKASTTNNQVDSVSTLASVNLYAVHIGGGNVVYGEAGKVYSWNSVTKSSTLRIETAPTQVMVSGSTMYFVMGAAHAVYKISLN